MKYKQKYLDKLYKDPVTNFTEIVDISIYLDNIGELDYGCEAVAAIESLDPITISNLLIEDLKNRKKDDFDNYGYQAIWFGLFNCGIKDIYNNLSNNLNKQMICLFIYWINEILEPDDPPYIAIQKIFKHIYSKPIKNFSKIVDLVIYFEDIDELDYSSEAVAAIQQLEDEIIANMLIEDLPNRTTESIKNYGYQRLWWSLINTEKETVYQIIKDNMSPFIQQMFKYWLEEELDPDVETFHNIKNLI